MNRTEKILLQFAIAMSGIALGGVIALSLWSTKITGLLAELTSLVQILVSLR